MKRVLSIQSHVAYGYVGNRAAVFPLQCMGFDVTAINTVQFSNHPGYGQWTGEVFTPAHIQNLINGLRDLGILHTFDAVLSGYLGDSKIGNAIRDAVDEIKKHNPACLYLCDPVMGDVDKGLFVKPDIPAFFKALASPLADILTPNHFELEQLTGASIQSIEDAKAACIELHAIGVASVLVTSFVHRDTPSGSVQMLLSQKTGENYLITTPYLQRTSMPNGTGDLTAALYLGLTLKGIHPKLALEQTAEMVFTVLETTKDREINIIENKNIFSYDTDKTQKPRFSAISIP